MTVALIGKRKGAHAHGESRGTLAAAGNLSPLGKPSSRDTRRVNRSGGLEVIF